MLVTAGLPAALNSGINATLDELWRWARLRVMTVAGVAIAQLQKAKNYVPYSAAHPRAAGQRTARKASGCWTQATNASIITCSVS